MDSNSTSVGVDRLFLGKKAPLTAETTDDDMPQVPNLPASLDIDVQMNRKKYPITCPGPGMDENEAQDELLYRQDSIEHEMDSYSYRVHDDRPNAPTVPYDSLRDTFEIAALSRPRPTTPTSWNVIENYVDSHDGDSVQDASRQPPDAGARMLVNIPGKRQSIQGQAGVEHFRARRQNSMTWSDFYDSMSGKVLRQSSALEVGTEDLLDRNPFYREMAPPTPVVHKRTSQQWELFDQFDSNFSMNFSRSHPLTESENIYSQVAAEMDQLTSESPYYQLSQECPLQQELSVGNESYEEKTHAMKGTIKNWDDFKQDGIFEMLENSTKTEADVVFQKVPTEIPTESQNSYPVQNEPRAEAKSSYPVHIEPMPSYHVQPESQSIYSVQPEQQPFYPVQPEPISSFPIQPEPQPFYPVQPEQQPFYPVQPEPQPFYPFQPEPQPFYPVQPEQQLFYPVQPEPISYYPIQPEPQPFYPVQPKPISSYPVQPESQLFYPIQPEPQSFYSSQTDSAPLPPVPLYRSTYEPKYLRNLNKRRPSDPFSWESQEEHFEIPGQISTYRETDTNYDILKQRQDDDWDKWEETKPAVDDDLVEPQVEQDQEKEKKEEEGEEKEEEKEEEEGRGAVWLEFQQMNEKISMMVKQSEESLKLMEDSSVSKKLPDKPYDLKSENIPEKIMDLTDREMVARMDEEQKYRQSWKPISQRLNEDIKKEKDLRKPKRPPPPKGPSAFRPPIQTPMSESWDEQEQPVAPDYVQPEEKPPTEILSEDVYSIENDNYICGNQNQPETTMEKPADTNHWTGFEDHSPCVLSTSESDFFSRLPKTPDQSKSPTNVVDPFTPLDDDLLMQQSYDPFEVKSADELMAIAKRKAFEDKLAAEAAEDLDFFSSQQQQQLDRPVSRFSSPTPEGGSPVSFLPAAFDDQFITDGDSNGSPSSLFDEDDSLPLEPFPSPFQDRGWQLMLRHPIKRKKLMGDRYWKPCFVTIDGNVLFLYNDEKDERPFHQLPLLASYSLSEITQQQYDIYGKIHTVKLQYVVYKERLGIRPGQISRLVEGHFTKYGIPLEHSAQTTVLLKFGCLKADQFTSFVDCIENLLFRCSVSRESSIVYKQDEIQIHCYDDYSAMVDKNGCLIEQKARVRLFCLAFLSGMPTVEIGLNDRRRQGKEIVRRKDILPLYTESWIRFENLEFHSLIDKSTFDKEHIIKFSPPNGCFLELLRFRVRPPRNREPPLHMKCIMNLAGSKVEIRIEAMVAGFASRKAGQVPCEDVQVRFPVPEEWIYLFREERHWGYGSVHAKVRRPGKVKNLKDRLMGAMQQQLGTSLIEVAIGEAKYEHVHKALVWRIAQLPEKHHGAYKNHLLK